MKHMNDENNKKQVLLLEQILIPQVVNLYKVTPVEDVAERARLQSRLHELSLEYFERTGKHYNVERSADSPTPPTNGHTYPPGKKLPDVFKPRPACG